MVRPKRRALQTLVGASASRMFYDSALLRAPQGDTSEVRSSTRQLTRTDYSPPPFEERQTASKCRNEYTEVQPGSFSKGLQRVFRISLTQCTLRRNTATFARR